MNSNRLPLDFIDIDGFRIGYHRSGKGEPMLLVHGITTYSFIWRQLIPSLSKQFDLIAPDLLGCGKSDKPTGVSYSIRAQAEILIKLLTKLNIEKVHLVAHDIGGGVAQIMAVTHPERIHTLTLINSIGYDYWPVQPIITMRTPVIRQLAMAIMDFGMLTSLVRRGIYHKERVTDELMDLFRSPLKTKEGRRGFLILAKSLDNLHLMAIEDKLKNMELPVLIIRGEDDVYLSPAISERLRRDIKGSRLVRIEAGGHFIQEDEPEQLIEAITSFIAEKNHA